MSTGKTAETVPVSTVDLKLHVIRDVTLCLGRWYGRRGFLWRSVETGLRGKTGLSRLKAGTNDGLIGIGLGRNRVLNLVRLSRGGASLTWPQRNSKRGPIGKVKMYIYFPKRGRNSRLACRLYVTA